jgi:phage replication O-like protein O
MASPQIEDGYTKIANEIMDALCKIRIPGEEMQVLNTIFRKTYGWNKCEDAISLSQFVETTGMNKPHIIQSIKGLLLKKVITITENGNAHAKVYKFNKNYDQWIPLPKKVKLPKTVINITENSNKPLPKTVPTKEKKEKKESTSFSLPEYIPLETWNAYMAVRVKKRAAQTP